MSTRPEDTNQWLSAKFKVARERAPTSKELCEAFVLPPLSAGMASAVSTPLAPCKPSTALVRAAQTCNTLYVLYISQVLSVARRPPLCLQLSSAFLTRTEKSSSAHTIAHTIATVTLSDWPRCKLVTTIYSATCFGSPSCQ